MCADGPGIWLVPGEGPSVKSWLSGVGTRMGSRYKETSGFCHVRPSPPETEVPNGGFSFDTTLKSFGPKPNTLKIQYQPPSLVRYFTPSDDGGFTSETSHVFLVRLVKSPAIRTRHVDELLSVFLADLVVQHIESAAFVSTCIKKVLGNLYINLNFGSGEAESVMRRRDRVVQR